MPRANALVALLAAIMLVIAGVPARAAASPCDPCPPDCPMMQQAAKSMTSMDHPGGAPSKGGKSGSPCDQGMACQSAAASVAPPSGAIVTASLTVRDTAHESLDVLAMRSRPPDRSLRPPIQL